MTMITSASFRAGEEETCISLSDQAPGVDPSLTPPGGCGSGELGGGAHFSSDTAIGPHPDGPHFITSSALLPSLFRPYTHSTPLTSDVGPGSVTEEITEKGMVVVAGLWGWGGPIAQDGMCRGEISRGAHRKEADGANGFLARGALSCNYTF